MLADVCALRSAVLVVNVCLTQESLNSTVHQINSEMKFYRMLGPAGMY